ncbi:hypothetical protein [Pedomonas sp. V897]|mgnify:FL=1|uniref:hypothetical protein n=1 Tax=Pedomonas sp. V897 TaxID=3446482 RepID=UPI003EDF2E96
MIAWMGGLFVCVAALLLYAASPNQKLTRVRRWVSGLAYLGVAAFAQGLVLLLQWAGPATAVFIALTLAMLVWTVVPLGIAWLRSSTEAGE